MSAKQIEGQRNLDGLPERQLFLTYCTSNEKINNPGFPTREEVEELYRLTHPLMPNDLIERSTSAFFREPSSELGLIDLVYLKTQEGKLAAAAAFTRCLFFENDGPDFESKTASYCIFRLVHPKMQDKDIGKVIVRTLLEAVKPDVMLTFTTQTLSCQSWQSLARRGELVGYKIYPRLKEGTPDRAEPETKQSVSLHNVVIPNESEVEMMIKAMKRSFEVIGILLPKLILDRIDFSRMTFSSYRNFNFLDHFPWAEDDTLAQTLGVGETDAILVAIIKE